MINARETAVIVLKNVAEKSSFVDLELKEILSSSQLSKQDRAFATELAYGVIRYKLRILYIIKKFSNIPIRKISPFILAILQISIYQLEFLKNIPQSAIVNESVELAKKHGHKASVAFVNGVLRSFLRDGITYPRDNLENLCVYYSFDKWFCNIVLENYGYDEGKKLLKSLNEIAPITVRVNPFKSTVDAVYSSLTAQNIQCEKIGDWLINIAKTGDISQLAEFKNGYITVQDKAAYNAGLAVNPKAGEVIIDVCAAPGGKTTHLAELCEDKCDIIAFDLHQHKTKLIEKNAKRLGINSIKTFCHNSKIIMENFVGKADKVLVDAPCSGLGIIRKKPDIKWNKSLDDIESLKNEQLEILNASKNYLKNGGRLVYSTCTVTPQENVEVVDEFLSENAEFSLISQKQYLPHIDNTDGFYIAVMERSK